MSKLYFYEKQGQQAGPVAGEQLVAYGVRAATLVWHEGMTEWEPAVNLAELTAFFQPVPPPLPLRSPRIDAPIAVENPVPAALLISMPTASLRPPRQPAPPPLALGEASALTGNHPPASPELARPRFSAESSTRKWWHYVIYAIAVFVMLLLFRACGVLLGQAVAATSHSTSAPTPHVVDSGYACQQNTAV